MINIPVDPLQQDTDEFAISTFINFILQINVGG